MVISTVLFEVRPECLNKLIIKTSFGFRRLKMFEYRLYVYHDGPIESNKPSSAEKTECRIAANTCTAHRIHVVAFPKVKKCRSNVLIRVGQARFLRSRNPCI